MLRWGGAYLGVDQCRCIKQGSSGWSRAWRRLGSSRSGPSTKMMIMSHNITSSRWTMPSRHLPSNWPPRNTSSRPPRPRANTRECPRSTMTRHHQQVHRRHHHCCARSGWNRRTRRAFSDAMHIPSRTRWALPSWRRRGCRRCHRCRFCPWARTTLLI